MGAPTVQLTSAPHEVVHSAGCTSVPLKAVNCGNKPDHPLARISQRAVAASPLRVICCARCPSLKARSRSFLRPSQPSHSPQAGAREPTLPRGLRVLILDGYEGALRLSSGLETLFVEETDHLPTLPATLRELCVEDFRSSQLGRAICSALNRNQPAVRCVLCLSKNGPSYEEMGCRTSTARLLEARTCDDCVRLYE